MIWKGRISLTFITGFALPAGERPWWVVPIGPWLEIKVTNTRIYFSVTLWLRWRPAFKLRRGWWQAELTPVRLEWCRVSTLQGLGKRTAGLAGGGGSRAGRPGGRRNK